MSFNHYLSRDTTTQNASHTEIAVLTEACQLFATMCVLALMILLVAALVSSLRPRRTGQTHPHRVAVDKSAGAGVTHLAVIMDGNRRYGRSHVATVAHATTTTTSTADMQRGEALSSLCGSVVYGREPVDQPAFACEPNCTCDGTTAEITPSPSKESTPGLVAFCELIRGTPLDGHRCGGEKLLEFIRYTIAAGIPMLTVYAFSTDNWQRPEREVNVLMTLFFFFFQRVRLAARQEGMFIRFVSTRPDLIPPRILALMTAIECETRVLPSRRITVNICVSYSGQTEIACASTRILERRWLCGDVSRPVTTDELQREMLRSLTQHEHEQEDASVFSSLVPREPQLIMRTSGEKRLSNFLSFESAYSEFFFLDKTWPEVGHADLEDALESYASRDVRLGR